MIKNDNNSDFNPFPITDDEITTSAGKSENNKINANSTDPVRKNLENITQLSFVTFSKKFSAIVFPGMLYYICIILSEAINMAYLGQTYKDEDMIKGIGVCYLYLNCYLFAIVQGLISILDTFCTNAYAAKKYRLMGIYLHRARIVGYSTAVILIMIHYFTFEKFLRFLNLNDKVINYSKEYIFYCFIYMFPDVHSASYMRLLNAIGKQYVIMIILLTSIILHMLWNYIFITILDLAVTGAGLSFVITRVVTCIFLSLYFLIWNPCPESNFYINKECFKGLGEFLKLAIWACLLLCIEWWSVQVMGIIAILLGEEDYTVYVITSQLYSLMYSLVGGFYIASSVISAELIVKASLKINKKLVWYSLLFGFLTISFILIFVYYFRVDLLRIFLDKPNIIEKATPIMPIICCACLFDNFASIIMGFLRGLGKTFSATVLAFIQYYIIMSLLSYVLSHYFEWGVYGIWFGFLIGVFTGMFLNLILYLCYDLQKIKIEVKNRLEHDEKVALISPTYDEDEKKIEENFEKNSEFIKSDSDNK